MKIKREIEEDLIVTWTDSNGVEHERDVTPADLERTGWVPLAAFVGPLDLLSPPTLAGALEAIEGIRQDADDMRHHYDAAGPEHNLLALLDSYESDVDTAHAQASAAYGAVVAAIGSVGAETIEAAVARLVADRGALLTRAEKAERELADAESRAAHMLTVIRERDEARDCGQASVCAVPPGCQRHWAERARELLVERDEAKELARVLEVERDEARRLHSAAEAQVACRSELRAQVAAADGRFRAAEAERVVRLDDMRKLALAVAARVRQERCLVAQAVAANVDIRVCEDDGGGFMVGVHESGCDEELARCVPAADVPATLARLLGEVSRG